MKKLFNFLKYLIGLLLLIVAVLYIADYDYLIKAAKVTYLNGHNTAFLDDYLYFDNRTIEAPEVSQPWPQHVDYNSVDATENLRATHWNNGSVAFMIIKNDSIWYEKYMEDYTPDSRSNSFSMAKSVISAMMGKAIMEGEIKGLDQPVGDYIPEFREGAAASMTVGDLSSMASGLNWDESYYSPLSITTRAYFDDDLRQLIRGLKVVDNPGEAFNYLSGNTQLLGMVLEQATGTTLAEYMSEKFWKPMGAEHPALWQIDSEESGMEKAYCCIAASARDFARFGKLYKDKGKWNGEQILPEDFVELSTKPRFEDGPEYGYGLWLLTHMGKDFFMLRGHLGQYVIVQPEDNLIIVRLGHRAGEKMEDDPFRPDIYTYIEESYKMLENAS